MFKPNYRHERAERRRGQQSKQEKKLKEQQDAVAERRARKGAPETIGTEAEDGDVETE
jgi:hypothetical protein